MLQFFGGVCATSAIRCMYHKDVRYASLRHLQFHAALLGAIMAAQQIISWNLHKIKESAKFNSAKIAKFYLTININLHLLQHSNGNLTGTKKNGQIKQGQENSRFRSRISPNHFQNSW